MTVADPAGAGCNHEISGKVILEARAA